MGALVQLARHNIIYIASFGLLALGTVRHKYKPLAHTPIVFSDLKSVCVWCFPTTIWVNGDLSVAAEKE